MKTSVCVMVDAEGVSCGLDCEYLDLFGVSPDSENPVPRCMLCEQFLSEQDGMVSRCAKCLDMERLFTKEADRMAMRKRVQGKPLAVSILEQTDYRVDLSSFASAKDLMEYLVEHEKISRTYLQKELGLSQPEFQLVMEGKEYPYITAAIQRHLGFPPPVHVTAQDEIERARKSLHWSELD